MSNFRKKQDTIKHNVEQILKNDLHSRSDDYYLCSLYLQKFANNNSNVSAEVFRNFVNILRNYKEYKLPDLWSIRRARQDLQKNNPELKALDTEQIIIKAEREHREYYGKRPFIID